jgi:hypothetical protein
VSSRTCDDWPELMEIDPGLQFKHFTVAELRLPHEIMVDIPEVPLDSLEVCCDPDHHVVNAKHTPPEVVAALVAQHWFTLEEWAERGGSASG